MRLVDCTLERHGDPILAILNAAILHTTAVYDYKPRPASSMAAWFGDKAVKGFPVLGIEGEDGSLLGFATYGTFRAWPAYKYTVESSVYVRSDARGRGVGDALLARLIDEAERRGVHTLIGGIDAQNAISIRLHQKHGFAHAGTIRQAGYKFGRWLDLTFYQRILTTPADPHDDA